MTRKHFTAIAGGLILLLIGACNSTEISDLRDLAIQVDSFGVRYNGPANIPDVEDENVDPTLINPDASVVDRSRNYTITIIDTDDQSVVFTGEFNQEGLQTNFFANGYTGFVNFEDVFLWTGEPKTYEATFSGFESTCSPQPSARESITFTVFEGSRLIQLVFQLDCWRTSTCEFCF